MVTFACREIRGGGLIKFFYSYFILAACESREDFFAQWGLSLMCDFLCFLKNGQGD